MSTEASTESGHCARCSGRAAKRECDTMPCEHCPPRVCVITVTYGSRREYLARVAKAVCKMPEAQELVIVDNGASWNVEEIRNVLKGAIPRLHFVHLGRNMGSAAGFKAGLACAYEDTSCDCFWLLDDDNVPREDALWRLICAWQYLGGHKNNVLLSLRPSNERHVAMVNGLKSPDIRPDSYFEFHLVELPSRVWERVRQVCLRDGKSAEQGMVRPIVRIQDGNYGGLFLSRQWVESVGFPDPRFYTYGDDRDFIQRMVQAGACVFLCGSSIIDDLGVYKPSRIRNPIFCPDWSPSRAYYRVRNGTYLFQTYHVQRRWVHWLNTVSWFALNTARSLCCGCPPRRLLSRLRLLFSAAREGRRGDLGEKRELPIEGHD